MNNFDQFEALTEAEVENVNGGGLLDLLQPILIVNDPLGLIGTVVDPLFNGATSAVHSIVGGVKTVLNNLVNVFLRPL
ncbi:hypothetical protein [Paraflavitalea speifideaquila]|uniref:hypothetical protein n=1 Tax=Paraflavitalea speifideaquila TaxID=3076558 RepID=UPI0028E42F6B|nr:hypothetical protein [Paraflavitalea speifideiaquila]